MDVLRRVRYMPPSAVTTSCFARFLQARVGPGSGSTPLSAGLQNTTELLEGYAQEVQDVITQLESGEQPAGVRLVDKLMSGDNSPVIQTGWTGDFGPT
jgi:hypothetical protein